MCIHVFIMAGKKYDIFEKSAISDDYGKTSIPKLLRNVLKLRKGDHVVWKTCRADGAENWTLEIRVLKKV